MSEPRLKEGDLCIQRFGGPVLKIVMIVGPDRALCTLPANGLTVEVDLRTLGVVNMLGGWLIKPKIQSMPTPSEILFHMEEAIKSGADNEPQARSNEERWWSEKQPVTTVDITYSPLTLGRGLQMVVNHLLAWFGCSFELHGESGKWKCTLRWWKDECLTQCSGQDELAELAIVKAITKLRKSTPVVIPSQELATLRTYEAEISKQEAEMEQHREKMKRHFDAMNKKESAKSL